jgi:crotonobetainyl-CoA:carnitine CoA-transferase CaiB-like acyl-CoA transferase
MEIFQPLHGIRVLDLSRVLAGPICSMVLADLGADVIKVERPGHGDDTRSWGPPFIQDPAALAGMSAYFASVNRNKRSLALNIGTPEGRRVLEKMITQCDVLLENFLPSSAAKLGIAPENLRRLNPNLVACSISGFGRTGPWNDQPGYDFVIQALSGLMSITGGSEPNAPGMKVGVALTDVLTGLYATVSIVAALSDAGKSNRGETERRQGDSSERDQSCDAASRFRHIDLALLDCTLASLVNVAQSYLVTGNRPERYGNAHPQIVPYESFQTADGSIALAVGNDDQFRRFCDVAGAGLAGDARFATNPARVTNRGQLIPELQQIFRSGTTAEWQRKLEAAEVPHAPVLHVDQAFALAQVQARQMVRDVAGLKQVTSPIKASGAAMPAALPPPQLGQHSAEVLAEFGYSAAEIQRLRDAGVI